MHYKWLPKLWAEQALTLQKSNDFCVLSVPTWPPYNLSEKYKKLENTSKPPTKCRTHKTEWDSTAVPGLHDSLPSPLFWDASQLETALPLLAAQGWCHLAANVSGEVSLAPAVAAEEDARDVCSSTEAGPEGPSTVLCWERDGGETHPPVPGWPQWSFLELGDVLLRGIALSHSCCKAGWQLVCCKKLFKYLLILLDSVILMEHSRWVGSHP